MSKSFQVEGIKKSRKPTRHGGTLQSGRCELYAPGGWTPSCAKIPISPPPSWVRT